MLNTINISCVPYEEECLPASNDWEQIEKQKKQCKIFVDQLERTFPETKGMYSVAKNYHDFGIYYDVDIKYNVDDPKQVDLAFHVEANYPAKWDEIAKQKLKEENVYEIS